MTLEPDVPATERDELGTALEQARTAARVAGLDAALGSGRDDEADPVDLPKVSFVFELSGMDNAPQVADLEAAVAALPGVMVRIVYQPGVAWVTAPEGTDPRTLEEVFRNFGITAHLSDASLRRRMAAQLTASGSRVTGPGRRDHRRRRAERRDLEHARQAGRLSAPPMGRGPAQETTDVLFTAGDLLTRSRLVVSLLFSLPVLLLTYVEPWQFDRWQWVALALALPVVSWGAWPFHRALIGGVRRGLSALDGASSLAILLATLWSVAMLVFTDAGHLGWHSRPQWFAFRHEPLSEGELFLDVACGITVLLLVGRALTRRARTGLLEQLAEHLPDPTTVYQVVERHRGKGSSRREPEPLPLSEVNVGDDILVTAGQVVPVDGTVVGGSALVGPGPVRASSRAEEVKVNSQVLASTTVLSGKLKIRVARTGHRTRVALVRRWVERALRRQNHSAWLSTRTASLLIPGAFIIAALDFGFWWLISSNLNAAFATSLAVLAGVAPVALALSTALAIRHGLEAVARHGVLVRGETTVRTLSQVDTVIFNRVGTLAERNMRVSSVTAERGEHLELVLRVAGALALESEHPVSQALVRAAREARDAGAGGDEIPHWIEVHHADITPDGHFTGMVTIPVPDSAGRPGERQVEAVLWRPRTMAALQGRLATAAVAGGTPLVVRWNGRDRGVITLHDSVKADAEEAIDELEAMGVTTTMLSRDAYPVARRFADRIGITNVLAGIAPGRKPQTVRAVHTRGATVAMVGDGSVVECLRVADVGILAGTSETLERLGRDDDAAVDVVLVRDDVSAVPHLVRLSRRIIAIVDHNIVLAWLYNALVILAAVSGVLHPMAATVLMLGASLLIEARSNLARRF